MLDVRIICTHDAAKLAETLMRLLEAEGEHRVRLTVGRQAALAELEESRAAREAVLLIWSPDARSQNYMHDWAKTIDVTRVAEISLTNDVPRTVPRKAHAIDFAHWRGARGTPQWNALNDRLRGVSRALNPPKPPPKYAAFALGMASAAAVTGAIVLRVNDPAPLIAASFDTQEQLTAADPGTGIGGPIAAIEPASLDDYELRFGPVANIALIRATSHDLAAVPDVIEPDLRDPTLMERISAFNPLRDPTPSE